MTNFISEDDIEKAILSKLKKAPFDYDIIICDADPSKRDDLNDGTNRETKKQCVLPKVLLSSLLRINPDIPQSYIEKICSDLCKDYTNYDLVEKNYELYNFIRNSIQIKIVRNGKEETKYVRLVDFNEPINNSFTAVSQMWIQGKINYRRPDVIIFVNGLPLVFIELKNSIVKVEEAYNKNLKDYLKDIPNLFAFNQICVLSNGIETRLFYVAITRAKQRLYLYCSVVHYINGQIFKMKPSQFLLEAGIKESTTMEFFGNYWYNR